MVTEEPHRRFETVRGSQCPYEPASVTQERRGPGVAAGISERTQGEAGHNSYRHKHVLGPSPVAVEDQDRGFRIARDDRQDGHCTVVVACQDGQGSWLSRNSIELRNPPVGVVRQWSGNPDPLSDLS